MRNAHRNFSRAVDGLALLVGLIAAPAPPAPAQVNVLTWHNDNARTGQNLNEQLLSPGNVKRGSFGLRFSQPVDGIITAQPLYVSGVEIAGRGRHNIVIVATAHDSVYAFDADGNVGPNAVPLWQVSFLNPKAGITTVPVADMPCDVITPELGIMSTPVIDTATNTVYVVAMTKEPGPKWVHRLHALGLGSGRERPGSPVEIRATVPGTADGSGTVTFVPKQHKSRAALLLSGGLVYTAWSAHCDMEPYHGWVMAYDARTLAQVSVFNATPNGTAASFWAAGAGFSADANGNVFGVSANGTFDADRGGSGLGQSFIRFSRLLKVADYFAPFNRNYLNDLDLDLGSSTAVLLPDQAGSSLHPHLLVSAGKEGRVYLIDRDKMGGPQNARDSAAVQTFVNSTHGLFGAPAYFNNTIYLCTAKGPVQAFPIANATIDTAHASRSSVVMQSPGGTLSISAHGSSNGLVWLFHFTDGIGGVLRAFDAANVGTQLYSSVDDGQALSYVQFGLPTVADGKVYLGTQTALVVFGLLPPATAATGGVVNAATFERGAVAPGSLISIFGSNLAQAIASASAFPLPISLADTAVSINGVRAPLLYVSPTQINAQVPFEVQAGDATVVVSVSGKALAPSALRIEPAAPWTFISPDAHAVAQHPNGDLNDAAHPAASGSIITVYLTGLGALDHEVATGSAAPSDPLARALGDVVAHVGGQPAEIRYAGLTPGYAGLAQLNLVVPGVPAGDQPLVITIGGVASNTAAISVGSN
jgi:uncharacterized protein (TIGR03437 family)